MSIFFLSLLYVSICLSVSFSLSFSLISLLFVPLSTSPSRTFLFSSSSSLSLCFFFILGSHRRATCCIPGVTRTQLAASLQHTTRLQAHTRSPISLHPCFNLLSFFQAWMRILCLLLQRFFPFVSSCGVSCKHEHVLMIPSLQSMFLKRMKPFPCCSDLLFQAVKQEKHHRSTNTRCFPSFNLKCKRCVLQA